MLYTNEKIFLKSWRRKVWPVWEVIQASKAQFKVIRNTTWTLCKVIHLSWTLMKVGQSMWKCRIAPTYSLSHKSNLTSLNFRYRTGQSKICCMTRARTSKIEEGQLQMLSLSHCQQRTPISYVRVKVMVVHLADLMLAKRQLMLVQSCLNPSQDKEQLTATSELEIKQVATLM